MNDCALTNAGNMKLIQKKVAIDWVLKLWQWLFSEVVSFAMKSFALALAVDGS